MNKKPLTIEWQFVESENDEARLLEVFKILLNNPDEYEVNQKKIWIGQSQTPVLEFLYLFRRHCN